MAKNAGGLVKTKKNPMAKKGIIFSKSLRWALEIKMSNKFFLIKTEFSGISNW